MIYSAILWDSEDDSEGNVQHIWDHGLDVDDVEWVLGGPEYEGNSRSTGLPVVWGYTPDGTFFIVVYQEIDQDTIRVVTAYEVPEPNR